MRSGWNLDRNVLHAPAAGSLSFDDFVLDIPSGELRTGEARIVLQPQPFKVLTLLAVRSGQTVTREEMRRQLWSKETFVDFEGGLNFCIRQIRKALGEDARKPRYIETLHRRGYRFIAPVDRIGRTSAPRIGRPRSSHQSPGCELRPITLAVLPFGDLSFPPHPESLADGITELIVTYLSTQNGLRVVSRTSTLRYQRMEKAISRIGRELQVDRVLEGAVLHSGRRVQITARLIDTTTNQNDWAACYQTEMDDCLALQDDIAWVVTRDVALHLQSRQKEKSFYPPLQQFAGKSLPASGSGNFETGKAADRGGRSEVFVLAAAGGRNA